jgi:hypothetical protein
MNSWFGVFTKEEDTQVSNSNPELESSLRNEDQLKSIEALRQTIFKFKTTLYKEVVINDTKHSANTMEAMYSFHATFLQTIAYFIGLLDSAEVPAPQFSRSMQLKFKLLMREFLKVRNIQPDSYALLYNMLFQFSTQHPFDLGVGEPEELDLESENNFLE